MLTGAIGASPFLLLAMLACPIGMGLMMLFMGRGMMGGKRDDEKVDEPQGDAGSLTGLKAEQARLAEQIALLEERQSHPATAERVRDRAPDGAATRTS